MKTLKTLLMLACLGTILATASACRETAQGAGRDIEEAGESIQRSTN